MGCGNSIDDDFDTQSYTATKRKYGDGSQGGRSFRSFDHKSQGEECSESPFKISMRLKFKTMFSKIQQDSRLLDMERQMDMESCPIKFVNQWIDEVICITILEESGAAAQRTRRRRSGDAVDVSEEIPAPGTSLSEEAANTGGQDDPTIRLDVARCSTVIRLGATTGTSAVALDEKVDLDFFTLDGFCGVVARMARDAKAQIPPRDLRHLVSPASEPGVNVTRFDGGSTQPLTRIDGKTSKSLRSESGSNSKGSESGSHYDVASQSAGVPVSVGLTSAIKVYCDASDRGSFVDDSTDITPKKRGDSTKGSVSTREFNSTKHSSNSSDSSPRVVIGTGPSKDPPTMESATSSAPRTKSRKPVRDQVPTIAPPALVSNSFEAQGEETPPETDGITIAREKMEDRTLRMWNRALDVAVLRHYAYHQTQLEIKALDTNDPKLLKRAAQLSLTEDTDLFDAVKEYTPEELMWLTHCIKTHEPNLPPLPLHRRFFLSLMPQFLLYLADNKQDLYSYDYFASTIVKVQDEFGMLSGPDHEEGESQYPVDGPNSSRRSGSHREDVLATSSHSGKFDPESGEGHPVPAPMPRRLCNSTSQGDLFRFQTMGPVPTRPTPRGSENSKLTGDIDAANGSGTNERLARVSSMIPDVLPVPPASTEHEQSAMIPGAIEMESSIVTK